MGSLAEMPGLAFAVPALIAPVLFLLARWTLPDEISQRYAAAIAFAAAYLAGHLLSADDPLPSRHWHWIPFAGLVASILGPVTLARGIGIGERTIVVLLLSLAAAWMLVPTWSSLSPPRLVWVPLLAVGMALLALLLFPLSKRIPAPRLIGFLALSALAVAGLAAGLVSMTYATQIAIAGVALLGAAIAARFSARAAAGGIGLAYAWVVGGWAFVTCIDPQQPVYVLLLAPFAPLALWCCVAGPAGKLKGFASLAVQALAVGSVLAIAAGIAIATIEST